MPIILYYFFIRQQNLSLHASLTFEIELFPSFFASSCQYSVVKFPDQFAYDIKHISITRGLLDDVNLVNHNNDYHVTHREIFVFSSRPHRFSKLTFSDRISHVSQTPCHISKTSQPPGPNNCHHLTWMAV